MNLAQRRAKREELATMARTIGWLAANEHASDAEHDAAMAAVDAVQKLIEAWDAGTQVETEKQPASAATSSLERELSAALVTVKARVAEVITSGSIDAKIGLEQTMLCGVQFVARATFTGKKPNGHDVTREASGWGASVETAIEDLVRDIKAIVRADEHEITWSKKRRAMKKGQVSK